MEIVVVGWHLEDAPYTCKDCKAHAEYLVYYKDDQWQESFNLCGRCAQEYTVVEDKIDKVFRNLGM